MQVIIYPNADGGISVITPAPQYADQIEAVAHKDVPDGTAFRIVQASDLPPYEDRARWLWTESGPLSLAEVPLISPTLTET